MSLGVCMAIFLSFTSLTQPALASVKDQVQGGVNDAAGGSSNAAPAKTLNDTISEVINLLSAIVGVVAVIMIILGGFRYITSGGDSNKVTAAKNTLIYAVIGLIVVALAQTIVHFALTSANSPSTAGKKTP